VLNLALAVVLLALVGPVVTKFGGKPVYVQIALVGTVVLVLPLVVACLASALRPGSLGRFAGRLRRR
jgi:hypothetical protein